MGLMDLFRSKRKQTDRREAVRPELTGRSSAVEVGGPWMNAIWSDVPVELPSKPDVPAFFAQNPVPPLLDKDGYRDHYTTEADWALHWIIALLHHPDESVVLEVVRYWEQSWNQYVDSEVKMSYRTLLFDSAADHLLSENEELADATARLFWRGYSEENWETVTGILRDPGFADEKKAHDRLTQCRHDGPYPA